MDLVFRGLTFRPFFDIHVVARSIVVWRVTANSLMSFPLRNRVVSSANRTVVEPVSTDGRSLMKTEKREGPSIEPWGTPEEG